MAATATTSTSDAPKVTAQQKRDMATLGRIQDFLKVEGTPYVVLSVDGPIDTARLTVALNSPLVLAPGAAQGLLHAGTGDPSELFASAAAPGELDDGDEDDGEDEDEPEQPDEDAEPVSPETLILNYLRDKGPSDSKSIAAGTGLHGPRLGAHLVGLMNDRRVAKNGLAYAAL